MGEVVSRSNIFNKFLDFLDKNTTLLLVLLLGGTLLLRFKYMTVNAGVWWDEAEYLHMAKHYAFGLPDIAAPYRERAMAMFYGLLYKFGATEWVIRVLEQFMSVVILYFVYLIGKEFYGKKVGLVAALMYSVFWVYMFWATRISGELFMVFLWVPAVYFFWRGYVKGESHWFMVLAGILVAFGVYAYSSMGFILFLFLAFVLITDRLRFLKNKGFWCAAIAAMIVVVPFAIYSYESFGSIYPRFQRHIGGDWGDIAAGQSEKWESGGIANFFAYALALPSFLKWPFFVSFLIGLIFILGDLALGFDLLVKGKDHPKLKKSLYLFLWVLIVLIMFGIVYATTGFEFDPRFLFPMYPAVFLIAAKGLFKVYDFFKKYERHVAFVAVAAFIIFGVYVNLTYANGAINAKKDSYIGEKEAGLWVKDNTNEKDAVLICNQEVIFSYYTERVTGSFGKNVTLADELMDSLHPKYVILDGYNSDCAFNLEKESSHILKPTYATFMDADKKQLAVIVYEVVYK